MAEEIRLSKHQRNYICWKAARDAASEVINEWEMNWMEKHGHGRNLIYCLSDEAEFDFACDCEDSAIPELQDCYTNASKQLACAEEALVDWSLRIAKYGISSSSYEALERGKNEWKIRSGLIKVALKINIQTLPEHLREE